MKAIMAVGFSLLAPIAANAENTATPVVQINPLLNGPQAQIINGSALPLAIRALNAPINDLQTYADDAAVLMAEYGNPFEVVPSARNSMILHVSAVGGTIRSEQEAAPHIGNPMLRTSLGKLRAMALVSSFLARENLRGVTDLHIASYDVLVFPVEKGKYAGDYVVALIHHRASGIKEMRAGCIDSSGGHNGSYFVNTATHVVIPKPCS